MAFKIDYQAELNKEQYRAVKEGDGPCLILAGAGSGKTRTIIYRLAYLLEQGVKPENILLVTFTNKAAKQMLQRSADLLGYEPAGLWGGTFHHIASKILRSYASLLGFSPNFTILDEDDALSLLKNCGKQLGFSDNKNWPASRVVKGIFSYAKNSQQDLAELIHEKYQQFSKIVFELEKLFQAYEMKKQESNAFDFDDLLVQWLRLLVTNKQIKERLSSQFHYILVDEYQDTNFLQAKIIQELSSVHHNVFVVGDDAQSIYSFRAADINNILHFKEVFPNAKIFKLETNYRSTPEILDLANAIIKNNADQHPKDLKTSVMSGAKPLAMALASPITEAAFIVNQLQDLYYAGTPWHKMAVLFRATHHSQSLEFELAKRGINYEYRGGLRFFERAHIKDILAFLRLLANPVDEASWYRLLGSQTGIGPATAGKIFTRLRADNPKTLSVALKMVPPESLGNKAGAGWYDLILMLTAAINASTTAEAIKGILQAGYRDFLKAEHLDWEDRLADLEQVGKIASSFASLDDFLATASLEESFATGQKAEFVADRLILSTIHQAKGLEWEAVFVINLADKSFPNQRSLMNGELSEERRLFYVAVTRAEKHLFLTYPVTGRFGDDSANLPSIFLREVSEDLFRNEDDDFSQNFTPRPFGKLPNDGEIHYLPDI